MKEPYNGFPPFEKSSSTSRDAARDIVPFRESQRERAYRWIGRRATHGAIRDEAEAALDISHPSITARIREMVLDGTLVETEEIRFTRAGRRAKVLVARQFAPAVKA